MTKVSFSRQGSPTEAQPVEKIAEPVETTGAAAGAPAHNPDHLPAAPSPASTHVGFYTGEGDDCEHDVGDVRLPRINIVQGLSGADLKGLGKDGTIILAKTLALPQPVRIIISGFTPKKWVETMPKFGMPGARTAFNLAEVADFGGSDQWRFSRECKDERTGDPVSRKPYFAPFVTAALLIEKPEGVPDDLFPIVDTETGKAYAGALYSVKNTSYSGFFVAAQTAKATGPLREGYASRFAALTAEIPPRAKNPTFAPRLQFLEPTSANLRLLAKKLVATD